MKKLIFILLVLLASCTPPPATVLKVDYLFLLDSIESLKEQISQTNTHMQAFQDSIAELKQHPLMTTEQFLQLYKYERLQKYYRICKKNPSQWKYYKGWSIRVFEQ